MAGAKASAPEATAPPHAPRSAKAARTAAAAASRRGLLSLTAADALLLVWVGAVWAYCAINATAIAASWALCPCSPVALVVGETSHAVLLAGQMLLPLGLPLLLWRDIRDRAQAREGGTHDPSALQVMVLAFCALVILGDVLIQKLAPTKVFCFWLGTFGPGLADVARFVVSVIGCFSFLPGIFLQVLQS